MANPRKKHRRRKPNRTVRHRARSHSAPMRRRRRSNKARRRRSNPTMILRNRHHRRRRSNPGAFGGTLGNLKSILLDSAWAIGGGISARSLPQAVAPNQNTGLMGYGLNILTAAVGSAAVTKFTRNAQYGGMFLLGGIVMTVGRAIDDYFGAQLVSFASFNPTASPMLSGDSAYDYRVHRRLSGSYVSANFPLPVDSIAAASSAAAAAAAPAAGMGWASRGYGRRAYN